MKHLPSRFRRLDDALADLPLDEPMLLSELDGFLTGILVCPDTTLPGEWLPIVWGAGETGGLPFDDPADVQWFTNAVMARYHEIVRHLDRGKHQPIFDIDERTGDVLWEYWIDGFDQAMALRPDAWQLVKDCDDEEAADALAYLSVLIGIARNEGTLDSVEINEIDDAASVDIMTAVGRLFAYRTANGAVPPGPETARPAKIGRNDPYACGSGKKFKRCCG